MLHLKQYLFIFKGGGGRVSVIETRKKELEKVRGKEIKYQLLLLTMRFFYH